MVREMLYRFYGRIVLVYTLVIAENVCLLLRPMLLGLAIEELCTTGKFGQASINACICELCHTTIGIVVMFVDTYVFSGIIIWLQAQIAEKGLADGQETTVLQGRVAMADTLARFFETLLPRFIKSVAVIVTSMVMLATYGWLVFAINAVVFVVGVITLPYILRIVGECAKAQHDAREQDVAVFATRVLEKIKAQLQLHRMFSIRWSNAQATNIGIMDTVGSIAVFLSIGLVALSGQGFAAAFAVHRYAANVTELVMLSDALQGMTRARDVLRRFSE